MQPFTTLHLSGAEAVPFLQSLTCNDVAHLEPGETAWNGICSPKGRLLVLFWMRKVSDTELVLTTDPENVDFLQMLLERYRFRRKVSLARGTETEGPEWATLIANGWPWILPANREAFLPQWVNLDLLGAVSFTKGCYPGQEVIARTRYLGEVKRRMIRIAGSGSPPAPGTPCFAVDDTDDAEDDGQRAPHPREAGRVVLAAPAEGGFSALISVRLTALAGEIAVGEPTAVPVTRLPLPYSLEKAP